MTRSYLKDVHCGRIVVPARFRRESSRWDLDSQLKYSGLTDVFEISSRAYRDVFEETTRQLVGR